MVTESARTGKSERMKLEIEDDDLIEVALTSEHQAEGTKHTVDDALVFAAPPRNSYQYEE